jgi:hypothetical protein
MHQDAGSEDVVCFDSHGVFTRMAYESPVIMRTT